MSSPSDRVFDIIEALANTDKALSLSEISTITGLAKSTVYRVLQSACERRYVRFDQGARKYYLGYRLLTICQQLLEHLDIRKEAHPFLRELVDKTSETANLVILDGLETVYIDQIESPNHLTLRSTVGSRGHLHSSAAGKILLAWLDEQTRHEYLSKHNLPKLTLNTITEPKRLVEELLHVRESGYAVDLIENENDVCCVAAPIRDFTGKVVAALSLSGPASRVTIQRIEDELSPLVVETALKISIVLGWNEKETEIWRV